MNEVVSSGVFSILFIDVCIYNGWWEIFVSDEMLWEFYVLMKWGLILVNCFLVCIVFICIVEGKECLCLVFFSGNL